MKFQVTLLKSKTIVPGKNKAEGSRESGQMIEERREGIKTGGGGPCVRM